jgi:hypothetical protein
MDWPLSRSVRYFSLGTVEASAGGTVTVVSANQKGSPTTLSPSLPHDVGELWIFGRSGITAAKTFLVDVLINDQGVDQVVLPNLLIEYPGLNTNAYNYNFPLALPKGAALKVRTQGTTAGSAVRISALARTLHNTAPIFRYVDSYGEQTSGTTRGTPVVAPNTVNTLSAWTVVATSTRRAIKALMVAFGEANDTNAPNANFVAQVGVGNSGQEQVIVEQIVFTQLASLVTPQPAVHGPFAVSIPAGSRISMRIGNNVGGNTTISSLDCIIYGMG